MSSKTPSSLKWLVGKRSRLAGKLTAYQQELVEVEERQLWLQSEIERSAGLIAALDSTIGLHEIQIEPSNIRSTRPTRKALFGLGTITRSVLAFLRSHPDQWFSTGELVSALCAAERVSQTDYDAEFLRRLLRRRLRAMAANKVLERPEERTGNSEQRWRLSRQRTRRSVQREAEASSRCIT